MIETPDEIVLGPSLSHVHDETVTAHSVFTGYRKTASIESRTSNMSVSVTLGDHVEIGGMKWNVKEIISSLPGPEGGIPYRVVLERQEVA